MHVHIGAISLKKAQASEAQTGETMQTTAVARCITSHSFTEITCCLQFVSRRGPWQRSALSVLLVLYVFLLDHIIRQNRNV